MITICNQHQTLVQLNKHGNYKMRWKIIDAKPQEKKFCICAMISELSWRQIIAWNFRVRQFGNRARRQERAVAVVACLHGHVGRHLHGSRYTFAMQGFVLFCLKFIFVNNSVVSQVFRFWQLSTVSMIRTIKLRANVMCYHYHTDINTLLTEKIFQLTDCMSFTIHDTILVCVVTFSEFWERETSNELDDYLIEVNFFKHVKIVKQCDTDIIVVGTVWSKNPHLMIPTFQ